MTKAQAINTFLSSFSIPAYPTTAVPDDALLPYMTYEARIGNAMDSSVASVATLYYHTESEAVPNAKAEEIAQAIGLGGKMLSYDGGALWIRRGSPWCVPSEDTDQSVKVRTLNLEFEYM